VASPLNNVMSPSHSVASPMAAGRSVTSPAMPGQPTSQQPPGMSNHCGPDPRSPHPGATPGAAAGPTLKPPMHPNPGPGDMGPR
jgi:hypothetical protein